MNLSCLDQFFTFRVVCPGGTYVRPKSGLHIEDLPGFSTASLSAVEPGKYLNAQKFVDEKIRFSGELLIGSIKAHLEQYKIEGAPKEAGIIGTWDESVIATGTIQEQGLRLKVGGGPMMVISVPRVWIRVENDIADLVLYIREGEVIHERTVTVKGNGVLNEIYLHFESAAEKTVDIYVADERFLPYSGSTAGTTYFTTCSTCGGHSRYKFIAGGGLLGKNEVEKLRGIRAEVVALCSVVPVACLLLRRFRMALLYMVGVQILHEWLGSPRTNYFAIHSKEWAVSTMEKWEKEDVPRNMKLEIKTLASLVGQLDPGCLECGVGPNYGYAHP